MDQENRFEAIFNCIDIAPLLHIAFPKYRYGPTAPIRNDHVTILYSLHRASIAVRSVLLAHDSTCPFATQDECRKVYKIKITNNLKRYCAPARGNAKEN
jgi:hypothetical protein